MNSKQKIVVVLLFSVQVCRAEITHSWRMQLCLNGTLLETDSVKCKYGVWFTEPKVVHKICFENGVWAIYREFCESNPVIWTVRPGTQGCIEHHELGNRILGIISIGRDEYGAVLSTSHRKLFFSNHKLKHGMRLNFLNPPAQVSVLTWGPSSYTYSLQQFVGDDILQQCLIKGHHSFFGYYKIQLESHQNTSLFLAKDLCLKKHFGGGTRVQVLPSEFDFNIIQSSSEEIEMNCKKYVKIDETFEPDHWEDYSGLTSEEKEDTKKDKKIMSRLIGKKVDEETQRIVLRLLGYHFNEDRFDIAFEEWEFLDVAKQIFLKVCPDSMVPEFFVEQIHLLFQAALQESFRLFPEHVSQDEDSRQRILTVLRTCLDKSTRLPFKDEATCTKDAPLLRKEFSNGTKVLLLVDMPAFIKIDVVNYDLIMEAIWKLMNFAHYYCADLFQNLSTDHSLLEGHWYRLFSPQVIRRWKYPGLSYRVLQQLFMSINLKQGIRNMDFCVSAARLHSSYKGWLKRPLSHWDKIKKSEDNLKGATPVWDGEAHCMDDFMFPAFKLGYPIEKCGIRLPELPNHLPL